MISPPSMKSTRYLFTYQKLIRLMLLSERGKKYYDSSSRRKLSNEGKKIMGLNKFLRKEKKKKKEEIEEDRVTSPLHKTSTSLHSLGRKKSTRENIARPRIENSRRDRGGDLA